MSGQVKCQTLIYWKLSLDRQLAENICGRYLRKQGRQSRSKSVHNPLHSLADGILKELILSLGLVHSLLEYFKVKLWGSAIIH